MGELRKNDTNERDKCSAGHRTALVQQVSPVVCGSPATTHPSLRVNCNYVTDTRRSTYRLTLSIRSTSLKGNRRVGCASIVNLLQLPTVNTIC